ncbi:MAG: hypothetical protein ACOCWL_01305 [Thermoguttaceae bacterium]
MIGGVMMLSRRRKCDAR